MCASRPSVASENPRAVDTVVIGGGQAGLAAGYFLAQQKRDFVIMEAGPKPGNAWRSRWDSLRLFTPSQLDGLPGYPFPAAENYFPAKDEVAAYLETYAARFDLPVRCNVRIEKLTALEGRYLLSATSSSFSARNVIVAVGPYHCPRVPGFSSQLSASIRQVHSSQYRNPAQIPEENVLVVGAGNSGAEIALELAQYGRHVWLAGRDVGQLPIGHGLARAFGGRPAWWLMSRILTVDTPIGRRARPNFIHRGNPLGRANREAVAQAGVELIPRVTGVESGQPCTESGRSIPAQCVIWATGYRPNYGWMELPIFDAEGYPLHRRGIVEEMPGIYFLGLPFQATFNSSLLGGVGRDAAFIVQQIARSQPA